MEQITLDAIDLALLAQLQQDASLSNQALAELVHVSPPTCLRRIKRLREAGVRVEDLEIGRADLEDVFLEIMQNPAHAEVDGNGLPASASPAANSGVHA